MIVQVISCNKRDCPWHKVTSVGAMSTCVNPEAPNDRVARKMEHGTPEECPVKTKGPYLMLVTHPRPGEQIPVIVESVRKELDDWQALWSRQLDKSL